MSRDYGLQSKSPADLHIDYAGDLNPQQRAVVTAGLGPALVIAGAGSGKTRTLIYRVAYLLEHGVPADRILLLTFTNKAAREMMRRVADLLGAEWPDLWGGTFHSMGARILRRHASALGYGTDFTILDREDAEKLLKACLAEAEDPAAAAEAMDSEDRPKVAVIADIISLATNTQQAVGAIVEQYHDRFHELIPWLEELAERYAARKRAANVMDFDDLLGGWLELLRTRPEVLELYQRRFHFILVDEYQDTNRVQSAIIDLLAAPHQNVMAVGDDSQSIYSWRGAHFQNILEFPQRYPQAVVYKVETNYRSTPEILAVANAAIAPNSRQFSKTLTAVRRSGGKPRLVVCRDAQQQAKFIVHRLGELRGEGVSLDRMAVLYRSHFHAFELQLMLARLQVPFELTSGLRFFEQAHIKDVSSYLRFVVNPTDEIAFQRMVRLVPGIGEKSAMRLWKAFQEKWTVRAVAAWDPEKLESERAELEPGQANALATALQQAAAAAPKKAAAAWANLAITISQMGHPDIWNKPGKMIRHILEGGYEDYLKINFPNHRQRLEELEQMAGFAKGFSDLEEFLTQLSLLASVEAEEAQAKDDDSEKVRLSTIHQAKGLEFDVVFLIMLCDGLFPSARSVGTLDDFEEERRLFYVGITRARDELYLSYPLIRTAGNTGAGGQTRSCFLSELPTRTFDELDLSAYSTG
jgi:DNA helicase-2/ATP-dependent DNA helicase PcrA